MINTRDSYIQNRPVADLNEMGDVTTTLNDPMVQILLRTPMQDNVAIVFAQQYAKKLLFIHGKNVWVAFNGTRWVSDGINPVPNFIREISRVMNTDNKASVGSANFYGGVERILKSDPIFAALLSKFDSNNYLLNTPSGTIDLSTGEMRPHRADDLITKITTVAPSNEGAAVFLKFLDEITDGDTELAYFLQVALGACLSGAVESHWMLFWTGEGRNGKNTLGDLVMDILGDYAKKIPSSTLLAKKQESHPTEIAALHGVRLAIASEVNEGEFWNEGRINELSGDSTLSARFMHGNFFEFNRTHKHLIYGNHRPQLRSTSVAIKSRLKIVPFKVSFAGREDADLPMKLRAVSGFVLQWLIEGHAEWVRARKKLPLCKAVDAETQSYFDAQSTPEKWMGEFCDIVNDDQRATYHLEKAIELYKSYKAWREERGEGAISASRFYEYLDKTFVKESSVTTRYRGIKLKVI